MAFGASWGCADLAMEQVRHHVKADIGELDETVFEVDRPRLAKSIWYLLGVSISLYSWDDAVVCLLII
jgi:hypothetical protein